MSTAVTKLLAAAALAVAVAGSARGASRTTLSDGWRFSRDGGTTWETVSVPHDWAIAGPYDMTEPTGDTARLPWRGRGLYRRTFTVSDADAAHLAAGGRAYLSFDGVMASPRIKVNGRDAGGWDYGYLGQDLDVSRLVRAGENEVEVAVDTTKHFSRWYPGAGIYRKVVFSVRPRGHVIPGTLAITTPCITAASASVHVSCVTTEGPTNFSFEVDSPRLWDVDDPHLHEITIAGERFRYGIRSARFTADDGFHLNGRRVQLKGVNLHSDMGLLGAAFDRSAAERQLRIMREMGVNAIRTSHNPHAPEFMDLCDEMGFLVWNECFDKWDDTAGRRPDQQLEEYVEDNLRRFVRRDRNHPCVIVWSIGNEIWEWDPANPRRSSNRWLDRGPDGQTGERNRRFRKAVLSEDPTRPVAIGNRPYMNEERVVRLGIYDDLDVLGFNYLRSYAPVRALLPGKPLVYTESASAVSTGGWYGGDPLGGMNAYQPDFAQVDSRDFQSSIDLADESFDWMEKDRYCAGEFVWTGIDYLGEPIPFAKEARSSYFGIVDITGTPKDRYYLYRSHWNPGAPTLHISPDRWTFPGMEGKSVPVVVYTDAEEAELFLNGRSLGRRRKGVPVEMPAAMTNAHYSVYCRYRLMWLEVPYEPGELKVVAERAGGRRDEKVLRTASAPAALKVTAEDMPGLAEGDLMWLHVSAVDRSGTEAVSNAELTFSVSGNAKIAGIGNADPCDYVPFPQLTGHRLFEGKAVAVLRRHGPGKVTVTVRSPGLSESVFELQ